MESVYSTVFSPWLSQEKITIALNSKRENTIFCRYADLKTGKERTGMLNEKTREILWPDPIPVIGMKMFGVAFYVTPITTTIRLGMHIVKFPYEMGRIFFSAIKGMVEDVFACRFADAVVNQFILNLLVGLVKEVVTRIFKVLRTISYSAAMFMAAVVAFMFTPDIGKRLYSLLETELNMIKRENVPKEMPDAAKMLFEQEVIWLPPCPHPWGNIDKDTYRGDDGEQKTRFEILEKSTKLSDFPADAPCNNAPEYCLYPCIPCC